MNDIIQIILYILGILAAIIGISASYYKIKESKQKIKQQSFDQSSKTKNNNTINSVFTPETPHPETLSKEEQKILKKQKKRELKIIKKSNSKDNV